MFLTRNNEARRRDASGTRAPRVYPSAYLGAATLCFQDESFSGRVVQQVPTGTGPLVPIRSFRTSDAR